MIPSEINGRSKRRAFLPTTVLAVGSMLTPLLFTPTLAQEQASAMTTSASDITLSANKPLLLEEVVAITLKNSPAIMQQLLGVRGARAGYQQIKGAFDVTASIAAMATRSKPISKMDVEVQDLTGALSKIFRTGVFAELKVGIQRTDLRTLPADTTNESKAALTLSIPLLKGRGEQGFAAAVGETAARLGAEAALYDYFHGASQLLLEAVNAYWDYKAAIAIRDIHKASEKRVNKWFDQAGEGVRARGEDPKKYEGQIAQISGYLSEKRRKIVEAEDKINSSKSTLAINMGIPAKQVANLGDPAQKFPTEWGRVLQLLQSPAVREKLVAKALDNRSDLKAQRLRHQISEAQLTKAKQDLLPQLDLTLVVGRNAQELGDGFGNYTGSVRGDLRGNDATGILKLTYPIGNTSAKGALDAASLEQQTSTITTDDKARTISVQVDTDASTVLRWLQEVDKASQAVDHYSPAIKNAERAEDKLLDNPGTIFNLMDLEDKYTEAFLNQLASWQELGKAIAQLRFQTGTLIKPVGDSEDQWELEALTTIPGIDGNP